MVCFLLSCSRERTAFDWIVALGLDLLVLIWLGLLIASVA